MIARAAVELCAEPSPQCLPELGDELRTAIADDRSWDTVMTNDRLDEALSGTLRIDVDVCREKPLDGSTAAEVTLNRVVTASCARQPGDEIHRPV